MKFSIKDFFSKCDQIRLPNPKFSMDLVTINEEILNGNHHFLCSDSPLFLLVENNI